MAVNSTSLFGSSETARAYAGQLRAQSDSVLNTLQGQLGGVLPGTTITARYAFRVGSDGGLIPLETSITTDTQNIESATDKPGDGKRNTRGFADFQDEQTSLNDVLPPKAQLTPTDEVALFAVSVARAAQQPQQAALANRSIIASDEEGTPVEAELLTPDSPASEPISTSLADRARTYVTDLYARNNDIIYNVTPVAALAA